MSRKNYTSETIRLEPSSSSNSVACESERNVHLQTSLIGVNPNLPNKISSFQITSIRPTSHSSNDGGDDSENDTEDTSDILDSSRVTADLDQETPSYSEDYSKSEEMLLSHPPVISTSSQYGIAAVVQTGSGMMTARLPQGVTVNVTEEGLALAKAEGEAEDLDNWQKRFTIVKINSNEPVTRGRWVCLDFMDSPAGNTSGSKQDVKNVVVSNVVIPDGDSNKPPTHGVKIPASGSQPHYFSPQYPLPVQSQASGLPVGTQISGLIPSSNQPTIVPIISGGVQYQIPTSQQIPNMIQPGYSASQPSQGPVIASSLNQVPISSSQPLVHKDDLSGNSRLASNTNIPQPGMQVGIQPGLVPHSQSEAPQVKTAPPQSIIGAPIASQAIQTPSVISSQSQPTLPPTVISSQTHKVQPSGAIPQNPIIQPVSSQPANQTIPPTVVPSMQSSNTKLISTNQGASPASISSSIPTGTPNYSSHPNTGVTPTPATTPAQASGMINIGPNQNSSTDPHLPSMVQPNAMHQASTTQAHPSTLDGLQNQLPESSVPTTTPPTGLPQVEETESSASTVAIDNKIEQAMDLVKSHLMFAVREEVEVLKEKIVELCDRIHNLECENNLLKQYTPQDTLQQVQQQLQQQQIQQPAQQSAPPHHSSTS